MIPTHKRKTILSEKKDESSSESEADIPYVDDDMDLSDIDADLNLEEGKYVIVKYEEKYYPGNSTNIRKHARTDNIHIHSYTNINYTIILRYKNYLD